MNTPLQICRRSDLPSFAIDIIESHSLNEKELFCSSGVSFGMPEKKFIFLLTEKKFISIVSEENARINNSRPFNLNCHSIFLSKIVGIQTSQFSDQTVLIHLITQNNGNYLIGLYSLEDSKVLLKIIHNRLNIMNEF